MQRGTENGQENDRCNKTLESEEILDLGGVSQVHEPPGGGLAAGSYLSIRYAEEGDLKHEVEHKATHSCRGDALASGYSIGDVRKAWPDGCEQDGHALTASCGLDTVCG